MKHTILSFCLVAVLITAQTTDALLSDILANLKLVSPFLVKFCRPLSAPANGYVSCEYYLTNLTCNAYCNNGYRFSDGSAVSQLSCNMNDFNKLWGDKGNKFPQCLSLGSGTGTGTGIGTGTINTGTGTGNVGTISGCIHSEMECRSRQLGDYPSCRGCNRFVSCANDGAFDRLCPVNTYFDNNTKRCEVQSTTCTSS